MTPEVQLFLRPRGKVEEQFKGLPKQTTDKVLWFLRSKVGVNEGNLADGQTTKYSSDINEFIKEQKALMDHLRNFRTHIHQLVPMKEQELKYYQQFADFLQKYEDGSERLNEQLKSLGGASDNVRLVSGDTKAHLKNKLDLLAKELVNPFIHVRNWIKGEMLNLGALIEAISEKEACDSKKQTAIRKLADEKELCEKLGQGKFTIKTMFKSKSGKAKKQATILEKIA
jgi:hypothetical protein